ncbi:hypothetical protein BC830DRAFT_1135397 [Chytriomyces sp. MP71]|nr:hypothetical protein BC830DRAFT_1135397 [Chytriomyces sp. MP71]
MNRFVKQKSPNLRLFYPPHQSIVQANSMLLMIPLLKMILCFLIEKEHPGLPCDNGHLPVILFALYVYGLFNIFL